MGVATRLLPQMRKPIFHDAAAIYQWVKILLIAAIVALLLTGLLAFCYERARKVHSSRG